jgi:orotate phosphoribosyltransferase-like protein
MASTSSPASTTAQKLIDRYDGGSGKPSLNYTNDQRAATQLAQYTNLTMTGLPPSIVKDDQAIAGLSAQLAQMDESTREAYSARAMKALQQPPEQRSTAIAALTADVSREMREIGQDPVRRLAAMFNAPVGTQYLQDGGRGQMSALRQQYDAFVAPGASDATRAQALDGAVRIKTQMQTEIQKVVAVHTASEQKTWSASAQRVERILNEAEHYTAQNIRLPTYTDDPQWNDRRAEAYAQTYGYQSIGEKLLSDDGLSQQERDNPGYWHAPGMQRSPDEKARDLLTFQQGLNDSNSTIFKRVHALESGAVHELTGNGDKGHYLDQVGTPKLYWNIGQALPQADGKYVQNLAQKYIDTTGDLDQKSRQMMREHTPDTLDKVLYATGKVLDSLMPLPGMDWLAGQLLDATIPNHGGLSSGEEAVLDTSLMVGGLLMGGLDKLPVLKGRFGPGEVAEMALGKLHPVEANVEPSLPMTAKERIARSLGALPDQTKHMAPQQPDSPSPEAGPDKKAGPAGSAGTSAPRAEGLPIPPSYEEPRPSGELDWRNNVFVDKQGGRHIEKDGHWYKVKYDADNGTLRVIHPQDASKPTYPVRIGANAEFEVHGDVGLKGGGPKPAPRELTEGEKSGVRRLLNQGMTPEEVSTQLGMPLGQVRGVLHGEALGVQSRRVKITAEKEQEILAALKKRPVLAEVAGEFGVPVGTVSRIAKENGVKLGGPYVRLPPGTRQEAVNLFKEGLSKAEIGRRLRISEQTVRTIANEYGLAETRGYHKIFPDKTVQQAVELLKVGVRVGDVAKQLNISEATVRNFAREHDIVLASTRSALGDGTVKRVIDFLNRGESVQEIAKALKITPRSISEIQSRNLLAEALSDFVATMGPEMTAAVQANLTRHMARGSGSTAEGTSIGGEMRPPGAGEPPPKRQRLEPDEPEDVEEIIPPYVDELMARLSPAQSPLMQNVWDDAVLLLDAEARRMAGLAGTSEGGAIAPGADVEAEAASRRLDADVDAVVAVLSDEDTDFLLQLTRDDAPRSA